MTRTCDLRFRKPFSRQQCHRLEMPCCRCVARRALSCAGLRPRGRTRSHEQVDLRPDRHLLPHLRTRRLSTARRAALKGQAHRASKPTQYPTIRHPSAFSRIGSRVNRNRRLNVSLKNNVLKRSLCQRRHGVIAALTFAADQFFPNGAAVERVTRGRSSGPWQPRLKSRRRGRGEESATPPPPSFARSRGRKASESEVCPPLQRQIGVAG